MQPMSATARFSPPQTGWVDDRQDRALVTVAWSLALIYTVIDWGVVTGGLFEPGFQASWLLVLSMALFVVIRRLRLAQLVAQQVNLGMILILCWMMASALWSPDPMFTITQGICIVGVSLIAFAFSLTAWHRGRFEWVMAGTTMLLIVASAVVCVLAPDISIHKSGDRFDPSLSNAWHGVTYQKNALGRLCALGVILWSYLWLTRSLHWAVGLGSISLCFFVLLQSRSNTSLMLALLSIPLMAVILRPMLKVGWLANKLMFGAIVIGVPVAIYLVVLTSAFEWVGPMFGKGTSFTGRTFTWEAMVGEIGKHPIIGIGFSSFWRGPGSPADVIVEQVRWNVNSAHNGFLDVTNELGLVGLALLLLFLALHTAALSALARFDRRRFALHAGLFLFLVLSNIGESGFFRTVTTVHLVMMFSSLEVSRQLFYYRVLAPGLSRKPASNDKDLMPS